MTTSDKKRSSHQWHDGLRNRLWRKCDGKVLHAVGVRAVRACEPLVRKGLLVPAGEPQPGRRRGQSYELTEAGKAAWQEALPVHNTHACPDCGAEQVFCHTGISITPHTHQCPSCGTVWKHSPDEVTDL